MRFAAALALIVFCATACGRRPVAPAVSQRARQAEHVVIPAGTTIAIRTISRIDSSKVIPSEGFAVVIVGTVGDAITSGSPARLVILPGQLGLGAVMVNGDWMTASSPLGTLVQAVLDTQIAQSTGTGNESMAIRTSGENIQVPAGTLLIFRNDQPITIGSGGRSGSD